MTNRRGSWDFLRMIFTVTIPTLFLLMLGIIMILYNDSSIGYIALWAGMICLFIELVLVIIKIISKPTGCDKCIYNTDDKFLEKYKIKK